uniref:Tachykinin-1 n=1 Tax=Schistocerca gregaria TaxID=7010 RepID=TKN1_SCHGR|nr:RecName: Full=Tachykinin-1; AltName: Full=Scg-midgut-TK [Schistocerca gregaria]
GNTKKAVPGFYGTR